MKRQVDSAADAPATVAGDVASSPSHGLSQAELDALSVEQHAIVTGDWGPFDRVIAEFLAEENAKVTRAYRSLTRRQCGRCDHLEAHHDRLMPDGRRGSWPGPCAFAFCACPGPESPG